MFERQVYPGVSVRLSTNVNAILLLCSQKVKRLCQESVTFEKVHNYTMPKGILPKQLIWYKRFFLPALAKGTNVV